MPDHVVSNEVIAPLCVKQFVACKLKKYEEEKPQIGQVIPLLDGGKLIIEWRVGSLGKMENQRGCTSRRNGHTWNLKNHN